MSIESRKKPKKSTVGSKIHTDTLIKLGHLKNTEYQRGTWVIEELQLRENIQLYKTNSRGTLVPGKKVNIEVAILRNLAHGARTRTFWIT